MQGRADEPGPMSRTLTLAGLHVMILGGLWVWWPGEPLAYSAPKFVALAAGLAMAWMGTKRALSTALDVPIAVFLAATLASTIASVDVPLSVLGDHRQPVFGLLEIALYVSAFYLGASLDEGTAAMGRRAVIIGGAVMGAVCVLQRIGLGPASLVAGRMTSTSGSPIYAGACLALALPLALSEALSAAALGRLAAPAIAAGLILTKTRSAWLAAGAGALALAAGNRKLTGRAAWTTAASVAVAAAAAVGLSAFRAQSDAIRIEVWRGALAALWQRPLLGFGPDAFSVAFRLHKSFQFLAATHWSGAVETEAHNDLLQVGVTLGLLGLAAFVAVQIALIAAAWPKRRTDPQSWSAVMGALIATACLAKLNPVPAETLTLAAWLAGTAVGGGLPAASWRRTALRSGAVVAAAAFAALWLADIDFGRANRAAGAGRLDEARSAIDAALFLSPGRLEYEQTNCELAIAEIKRAASPRLAKELTFSLLLASRQAARLHPGNPESHELYGSTQLFASSVLGAEFLPGAKAELELASAMDPTAAYPIQRRLLLAQLQRDQAGYDKASAELARIMKVAPVAPPD